MSEKERSSSFCSEMDYCFRAFQNSSSPNVVCLKETIDMSEGFGGKWTFQWLECLWMSLNVFAVIFDWDTLGCLVVSKARKNPTCQPLVPIAAAAARPHHLLSLATGASLKNVIGTTYCDVKTQTPLRPELITWRNFERCSTASIWHVKLQQQEPEPSWTVERNFRDPTFSYSLHL